MYFTLERRRSLAAKLFEHVRNKTTDMEPDVVELDLSGFTDPDVALRERERIFERLPMMALHSSQVPEPNSFATVRLNRSNVVVTRQRDGSLRAMVNACRHRVPLRSVYELVISNHVNEFLSFCRRFL